MNSVALEGIHIRLAWVSLVVMPQRSSCVLRCVFLCGWQNASRTIRGKVFMQPSKFNFKLYLNNSSYEAMSVSYEKQLYCHENTSASPLNTLLC